MRWLRASDAILFKTFEKNNLPALGFRHHKEREESPEETNASKSSWKALYRAGIFKISMGARHRLGIGLSYRPARLHRLAELMPWHRFLGSIKV
jgi:hypothetical protein